MIEDRNKPIGERGGLKTVRMRNDCIYNSEIFFRERIAFSLLMLILMLILFYFNHHCQGYKN